MIIIIAIIIIVIAVTIIIAWNIGIIIIIVVKLPFNRTLGEAYRKFYMYTLNIIIKVFKTTAGKKKCTLIVQDFLGGFIVFNTLDVLDSNTSYYFAAVGEEGDD